MGAAVKTAPILDGSILEILFQQLERRVEIQIVGAAVTAPGIVDLELSVVELHFAADAPLLLQRGDKPYSFLGRDRPVGGVRGSCP